MPYDVIIIGGGHAGTEAAWAAASVLGSGGRVALVTLDPARIGQMSCNPAIGGLGKGQMVREIDALGGLMGRAIDATGIMFKMLNTSKGPAVRGPRAQADKYAYRSEVQRLLLERPNIDVIAGKVEEILVDGTTARGVRLAAGAGVVSASTEALDAHLGQREMSPPIFASAPDAESRHDQPLELRADAVVLTTGTFMRGLMHTGHERTEGGRVGEGAAVGMSRALADLGFELGRLKTGTPPRLDVASIDWEALPRQTGDDDPRPFSDQSPHALPGARFPRLRQTGCRFTHTTADAHAIIKANLDRAPMYSGQMSAETGPRYCPSIEDKVVRFEGRDTHNVFLEPESLFTNEIYCNGISTSLPAEIQLEIVHRMPGCARATMLRPGYAVEYDMVWPHQLDATGMTKVIPGLFLAGQINCTTGYEEAGGQGVIAGLNSARHVLGHDPVRLGRDTSYIGVMFDDLVTKTPREPYRMFTSRAEHRLHLRADNADTRLTPLARDLGLIGDAQWAAYEERVATLETIRRRLDERRHEGKTLTDLARRPEMTAAELAPLIEITDARHLVERVMTQIRYAGYIDRQHAEIKRQRSADNRTIPAWLDPDTVTGLRSEAAEVLARFRPQTMGQAARLSGINPADLTVLAVAIRRGPPTPVEAAVL